MLLIAGTGKQERGARNGEPGTGSQERGARNGERGTGNGERGTGNGGHHKINQNGGLNSQ